MTFIGQEQGIETASPVELYDILYESQSWYYTSSDAQFNDVLTSRNYEPLAINRGSLRHSSDFGKNGIEIEVPVNAPFLDLFRISPPSGVVSLTIRRLHRTDVSLEIVSLWKGRIMNVTWSPTVAMLTCEPIRSSIQRIGLRRVFQRQCPHVLYSAVCGVSKALYELIGNVESISGNQVNIIGVSSFPENYFAGGYIEYLSNQYVTNERRMVSSNPGSTNQLILLSPAINISIGDEVRVYPGCDHTLGDNGCGKFDNAINFGGKPYTPTKNPFNGEPIY